MPIKTFWMIQRNIDRLEAAHDYRMLQIALGATTSEGVTKLIESLKKTIGKVVIYDEAKVETQHAQQMQEAKLDREGLARLRGQGKLR